MRGTPAAAILAKLLPHRRLWAFWELATGIKGPPRLENGASRTRWPASRGSRYLARSRSIEREGSPPTLLGVEANNYHCSHDTITFVQSFDNALADQTSLQLCGSSEE